MQTREHIDPDSRDAARRRFIENAGLGGAEIQPLAQDASFRRYFRIRGARETTLLMDAPPPNEDTRPFIRIDEHLRAMGLVAPRILARDTEAGFLLIEDFGDDTFTRLLARGEDADRLYRLAIDVLVEINQRAEAARVEAPPYGLDALLAEALLLPDWHFRLVHGKEIERAARQEYVDIWTRAITAMPQPAVTLVLRDFHVDNLMLVERDGVSRCALLDFQDALIGPSAYDLASLLQDARRDIEPGFEKRHVEYFLERLPLLDRENFLAWYALLAAQRHAKVLGIFSRLYLRDGKSRYLEHLPRVTRLLERGFALPALAPLAAWMDRWFPDRLAYAP